MPTDYQALAARTVERRIVMYERQVTAALQAALVEIRNDIGVLYERYAGTDGILTHAEMTRYNRLATAEQQIVRELTTATNANLATMRRLHPDMYNEAFFHYAWAIDQTTGLRLNYGRLNLNAIRENLASPMYHLSLQRYGQEARMRTRVALNNGLIRGQGYREMMRDLRTALATTRANAFRIVRTEGQRAANAGTVAAYAKAGGEGVEGDVIWVATMDSETRDQHQSMDGRTRDADGLFHLPNGEMADAPLDPSLSAGQSINCRCTTRYEITGYSPALRRDRDAGLIPYQPYSSWRPPAAPA